LITPIRNREEVLTFVDGERIARQYMNIEYELLDMKIIHRNDNKERDLVLEYKSNQYKTEEKFRDGDWRDLLVEILQCIITQEPGWFYTTKADLVSYVMCNSKWIPQRFYLVRWPEFKNWLYEYLSKNKFPKAIISPRGLGLTLNLSINWIDIPPDLFKEHLASCREAPWNKQKDFSQLSF